MPSKYPVPRDPAKPSHYFMRLADVVKREVEKALKADPDPTLFYFAKRHLRIAFALYSAGVPAKDCRPYLAAAADHFIAMLTASQREPLGGIPNMHPFLDSLSAAALSDRIDPCLGALRTAHIIDVKPWQSALLGLFSDAVQATKSSINIDLSGAPPVFGPTLGAVLDAVRLRDAETFKTSLQSYLVKQWAPAADRAARDDLKTTPVDYVGKWALHATAACRLMGGVPQLSAKALQYVMVDLVDE